MSFLQEKNSYHITVHHINVFILHFIQFKEFMSKLNINNGSNLNDLIESKQN